MKFYAFDSSSSFHHYVIKQLKNLDKYEKYFYRNFSIIRILSCAHQSFPYIVIYFYITVKNVIFFSTCIYMYVCARVRDVCLCMRMYV